MARTLATVQSEIDTLRAAMARGVVRVRHGETETTFADTASMQRALDMLLAEANGLATSPVKQVRFATSKGLDL
jgi:hypothetical protein